MNLGLATAKRRAQDRSAWRLLVATTTSSTSSWREEIHMHTNVILTNKTRTHAQSNYTHTKLKARKQAYSTAPDPHGRITKWLGYRSSWVQHRLGPVQRFHGTRPHSFRSAVVVLASAGRLVRSRWPTGQQQRDVNINTHCCKDKQAKRSPKKLNCCPKWEAESIFTF